MTEILHEQRGLTDLGGSKDPRVGARVELIASLVQTVLDEPRTRHLAGGAGEAAGVLVPDRDAVAALLDDLRDLMFPGFFRKRDLTPERLALVVAELVASVELRVEEQVRSVLRYARELGRVSPKLKEQAGDCDSRACEVASEFVQRLPELRKLLALDVQAAFDGDPAAEHTDEAVFCYPGIEATFTHRVAHELYELGVPLLPRIMQELAHSRTGIDLHPGATIGKSFFIDHGGGVVIGETAVIGDGVRIYQGVTLGAKSFETDGEGRLVRTRAQRHPTIGNRVTIYAGAVILGGDTVIGDDCVIGGSVFVSDSVPAGHMAVQKKPELIVRQTRVSPEGGIVGGG